MDKALIIDDDEDYRNLLSVKLRRAYPDIQLTEIDPLSMALPDEKYGWGDIDFIILDYHLGIDITGLDWYKRFNPQQMPATILLTAQGSEELAVRAIKLGIDDYIVKEQFKNEALTASIEEYVYQKRLKRAKLIDLTRQSTVFNKSDFIRKLASITGNNGSASHLLVFNPEAYHLVGRERGLSAQDNYINHVANRIYRYLSSKHVECHILVFKEEYVAVIMESKSYKPYLDVIYKAFTEEKYTIGDKAYPCSAAVGVISANSLDESELARSDFELLSIAKGLCDTAKCDDETKICSYGDINRKNKTVFSATARSATLPGTIDLEQAIDEGRVAANYQAWVYIAGDETVNVKDIYDVTITVIDMTGNPLSQGKLIDLLSNAFTKQLADRWVLRHSVTKLKEMSLRKARRKDLKLSVKLSLATVSDPEFIPWLKDLLNQAELPPDRLKLEIETSWFMRGKVQYQPLIEGIGRFFDIKFVLSGINKIDAYHLVRKHQRFDFIKLNVKDLVYGFPRGPLNELINGVRNDDARIVAINVTDAETLNMATDFDIDYVHGHLVGRPFNDIMTDAEGDLHCVL